MAAIKSPKAAHAGECHTLEQLPNVGPAMAGDLRGLGIQAPAALVGQDAFALYRALERHTGKRQDPCVLDTFMAVVDFMNGAPTPALVGLHARAQTAAWAVANAAAHNSSPAEQVPGCGKRCWLGGPQAITLRKVRKQPEPHGHHQQRARTAQQHRAHRAHQCAAVAPDSNSPSWLLAPMKTELTAPTRPRMASGVSSCTSD